MVTVSRRVLLPLLAPVLAPTVFPTLASNPVSTNETSSFRDKLSERGVRHGLSRIKYRAANGGMSYLKLQ
jgi:hypothetical protein